MGLWWLAGFPSGRALWRFLPLYILLKIATNFLIWYYSRRYNPDRLFFYANIGLSEKRLFLSAFFLDAALFFLFITIITMLL